MRIFFYVPDGIGVRNYLLTNIISNLKGHHIGLYHRLPIEVTDEIIQIHDQNLDLYPIPKFHITKIQRILSDLATMARLRRNSRIRKNPRIWRSLNKVKNPTGFMKLYFFTISKLSWPISHSIWLIGKLDALLVKMFAWNQENDNYRQLLETTKPDVIICTHQRLLDAGLMAEIAHKLNIPIITAIFSWDNLPKSRITLKADKYIVWSDYMKEEMSRYYPEVSSNDVIITGTPQFEHCYNEQLLWSKEQFCSKIGVPEDKKLVLFSGNDSVSPNDHYYLEDIANAIALMPESDRPHLILRRAPVDMTNRFAKVVEKYAAFITLSEPQWTSADETTGWGIIFPTYKDVVLLTNLCKHCDVVMNIGSTMGLDFAHFDKPAIYMNYEKPYHKEWYNISFIYGLEHFRSLDNLDAVLWVKDKEEIADRINFALRHPEKAGRDRLKWKHLLTNDIKDASSKIADLLIETASRRN